MLELIFIGMVVTGIARLLKGTTEDSDSTPTDGGYSTPEWYSSDGEEQRRMDYGRWKAQRDEADRAFKDSAF